MAKVHLDITRRTFLKGALVGSGGLGLAAGRLSHAVAAPSARDEPQPWYYQGEIKTTYNYCDMCPWRCGIVVQSRRRSCP